MNELKPEDVMKALECCTFNPKCDECPLGGEDCINLDQLALALLREKDAEIERLTQERDDARRDCAVAEQNHYECKKELEEMSDDILDSVRAERDRYKAESEQYQTEMLKRGEEVERLEKDFWGIQADIKMRLADARAEAITEFAERLKKGLLRIPKHYFNLAEVESGIDYIEKEMKGETDGESDL